MSSGSDCEDSSKDIRVWSLDKSSDMDIEPSGEQGSEAQTPTNSLDAYTITSILVGKLWNMVPIFVSSLLEAKIFFVASIKIKGDDILGGGPFFYYGVNLQRYI